MIKSNFKNIFLISFLLAGVFFSIAPQVQALQINNYPSFLNIRFGMSLTELVSMLFNFLLTIAGLAAFIMIVWGGVNFLTSAGDPTKMGDAKDQIFKALLGLVVMFASWMILNTINPQLVVLKEPGVPSATPATPQTAPVIVGYCAPNTTYGVKLFPKKNYQPTQNPLFCFNNQDAKEKVLNSQQIWSVQINQSGIAVKFFDEQNFIGRNICFIASYGNVSLCPRGGTFNIDKWPDSVRSVKIISTGECPSPGITLGENGLPVSSSAKCDGF